MEDHLSSAVADARGHYAAARPKSAALAADAARVMPGGNTRSVLDFAPFPFRVATASGAEVVDVDGHRYVDLLGNYTAGLLGHSPPAIRDAVVAALDRGWSVGATHPLEIELARLVCDRFASIEQVRFTNSGTEANLMAIGTALHHTGRSKVLVFEGAYHGGVLTFGHGANPLNVPHRFVVAPFNDLDALAAVFAEHADPIGCVLIEPVQGSGGCIPARPEFLDAVRRQSDLHGAVLVFDEVMTSRLAWGGAQERYGITPDMTTLGKYIAGGLSFGAFGGRRSIMAAFDPAAGGTLTQAGTFNNNVLSMAAGVACLRDVLSPAVLANVNARGDRLRERLSAVFETAALPITVTGVGSMTNIHAPDERYRELFFLAMLDAGWYLARRGFIALSLEITDDHVDAFCTAAAAWAGALAGETVSR